MDCPCNDDCICLPICKSKEWKHLIRDCKLIRKYFYTYEHFTTVDKDITITIDSLDKCFIIKKYTTNLYSYSTVNQILIGIIRYY